MKTFRALALKVHKSTQLSEKLKMACGVADIEYKKLAQDVETRWWSTIELCKSAWHLKPALD
ncbi:unnamed protein product, partial [Phaeothamnion confervicola]